MLTFTVYVGVIPSHGWGSNRNQLLSIAAPLIQNIRGRRGPRGEGRGTLAAGRGRAYWPPTRGPSNVERQSRGNHGGVIARGRGARGRGAHGHTFHACTQPNDR
ncbi:LOW QUALITY PROTEIN: hypothetical protein DAPPUDRAFT_266993 [Daphnia pulex]|uniref:Uncharacterized protein n=1 Tax=Daphnia pulex TaxID=6669 RepID=E9HVU9_DAPPU|nr:LOW QUALITY PROTEIN: hypothetical protein DAPPUDRAFT_266993 [Daphnia pulex]|eukprot:EFX64131.1 LOW QUALITY PROTEIN: hypothetical protein DAPPUDRAFT_266993 [Daphnia pulex]